MNWTVEGRTIKEVNGRIVTFDFPVKEVVDAGDVLVVLLEVPPDKDMQENVFGVSRNGEILWQIERIAAIAADPASFYTGLFGSTDGVVTLANWIGVAVDVDTRTGKVLRTRITK